MGNTANTTHKNGCSSAAPAFWSAFVATEIAQLATGSNVTRARDQQGCLRESNADEKGCHTMAAEQSFSA